MIWLSKSWEWIKKNWKYVITFGIPVILSAIVSLIKSNQSLKNKTEFKANEQIINKQASELEAQLLQDAKNFMVILKMHLMIGQKIWKRYKTTKKQRLTVSIQLKLLLKPLKINWTNNYACDNKRNVYATLREPLYR